ncbi:MAG: hypothetical protein IPM79_10040 [Polyangiaceae bacterium]|jgi:hypothetical protein|nr:hypothetical protein [Polyangiaceae bacterium]MBK8937962.1 hypothetical protein [Polyangiaceae bacterium]
MLDDRLSPGQTLGSNVGLTGSLLALVLSHQVTDPPPPAPARVAAHAHADTASGSLAVRGQELTEEQIAAGAEMCRLAGVDPDSLSEERLAELRALWR